MAKVVNLLNTRTLTEFKLPRSNYQFPKDSSKAHEKDNAIEAPFLFLKFKIHNNRKPSISLQCKTSIYNIRTLVLFDLTFIASNHEMNSIK
jgi:hypothetical protein